MAVVEQVETQPYADHDRMAAAGGSYGGYMVNWLLGHTDKFSGLRIARRRVRPAQHGG